MSVAHETLIYCDGGKECPMDGCYCDGDSRHQLAKQQRASFPINGWLYRNGKDYCGACAKRLFNVEIGDTAIIATRDETTKGD